VQRVILVDATRDVASLDDVDWEALDAAVIARLTPL